MESEIESAGAERVRRSTRTRRAPTLADVLSDAEEIAFREEAFVWLRSRLLVHDLLSRADLAHFPLHGKEYRLIGTQSGIWWRKDAKTALSISTSYVPPGRKRPYEDSIGADGLLRYKWRGNDGNTADNVALRLAMQRALPLIWFRGERYALPSHTQLFFPQFPVTIVAEEPESQQFVVKVEAEQMVPSTSAEPEVVEIARVYNERLAKVRVHQPAFRAAVLSAYERRCAVCGLPFPELLDAAHIRSDADGGSASVPNGLALCKIHHGAYDKKIIGITADCIVRVKESVLETFDGPTLQYAIKGMEGEHLRKVPKARSEQPDRDLLAERFEEFEQAS